MGVLDRLKAYQRLQQQKPEMNSMELSTLDNSQDGGTTQPDRSFLQNFILEMLTKNNVPVQALKFVPGFGEHIHKILFGDPLEAHAFFANMHYQVGELLRQDEAHDPIAITRKQEYAEAEARAINRRSLVTSASGSEHDFGQDWKRQIDPPRHPVEEIPSSLPDFKSIDNRQQATLPRAMEHERDDGEQVL